MLRAVLGLFKGGLVGAAVGFGAWKLGLRGDSVAWLLYALVGFLVGVVCGRPLWRQETLWTPVLKGIFGAALCLGLAWVARRTLGGVTLPLPEALGLPAEPVGKLAPLVTTAIGIVYGIFVEVDDGGDGKKNAKADAPAPKS